MGVSGRGFLIGGLLLAAVALVTVDHLARTLRERSRRTLRREAPARVVAPQESPSDPEGDALLVIRLGGARIPPRSSDSAPQPSGMTSAPSPGPAPAGGSPPASDPPAPRRQPPPAGTTASRTITHVVAAGETLGEIAVHYFGDYEMWRAIATWNAIGDARKVRAGQELIIHLEAGQR